MIRWGMVSAALLGMMVLGMMVLGMVAGCSESADEKLVTSPPQLPVARATVVEQEDVEVAPEPVVAPIPLEQLEPAALVDAILDESTGESVRRRAAVLLARIGPEAASETHRLKPALESEHAAVQLAAALALSGIDGADDAPIPILIAALKDKDVQVRIAVLNTFAALGERGQPAAAAIIGLLSDERGAVCETAVFALHAVGVGKEQLPALLKQLEHERARPYVLDAMTSMRKNAVDAIPQLVELLGTGDEFVQQRLSYALAAIGKPAIPALTDLIADDAADEAKRIAAAGALGTMGRHAAGALPALRDAMIDASPKVGNAIRGAIQLIEANDP